MHHAVILHKRTEIPFLWLTNINVCFYIIFIGQLIGIQPWLCIRISRGGFLPPKHSCLEPMLLRFLIQQIQAGLRPW